MRNAARSLLPLYINPSSFLIEEGMRWKRGQRLKLVSEEEAPESTRAIFRDIRDSLGVPVVPTVYQAYAAFPQFLELHWRVFQPVLQTAHFFLVGSRLAAEAYTRAHNYFEICSLRRRESARVPTTLSLAQVLDYYQYLDPLQLLVTAAQMQAFEGPTGGPQRTREPARHPQFTIAPALMSDQHASPGLQRSWNERKRVLELALVSDEHRALACWPEFYAEYWTALRELLQSPVYADCQFRLAESALSMTSELPVRVEVGLPQMLEAGLSDEQVTAVMRMNEALMQALTGVVLDITFARIGYEGGTRGEPGPHTGPASEHTASPEGSPIRAA